MGNLMWVVLELTQFFGIKVHMFSQYAKPLNSEVKILIDRPGQYVPMTISEDSVSVFKFWLCHWSLRVWGLNPVLGDWFFSLIYTLSLISCLFNQFKA